MAATRRLLLLLASLFLPRSRAAQRDAREDTFNEVLQHLFSVTLAHENVFLIIEDGLDGLVDEDVLFLGMNRNSSSVVVFNLNKLIENELTPASFGMIRSENSVTVMIYNAEPTDFLNTMVNHSQWSPYFLLLINLNADSKSNTTVNHVVTQRSRTISYLSYEKNRKKVTVQKIKHIRPGANEFESNREFLGFYELINFTQKNKIFKDTAIDLSGSAFQVSSWCDDYPYLYSEGTGCTGSAVELMRIVSDLLGAKFHVQMETPDGDWGSKVNGTWTGMLRDLWNLKKHIVINLFLLNTDRAANFDFTYPHTAEGFGFSIRNPAPLPKSLALIYPFTGIVWATFFVVTVIITTSLTVLVYFFEDTQKYDGTFLLVSITFSTG